MAIAWCKIPRGIVQERQETFSIIQMLQSDANSFRDFLYGERGGGFPKRDHHDTI